MDTLKNYIIKQVASNKLSQDEAKAMLKELKQKNSKADEEIAIIGMACRFPGADNTEEYWNNLSKGVNCISDPPEQRIEDMYSYIENPDIRNTLLSEAGLTDEQVKNRKIEFIKSGYLDNIDKFDAGFFHIPPKEAKYIDPLQRVFLETAWESIEDAGYGGKKIYGTKTGVFVGRDNTNTSTYKIVTEPDQMHLTGSWTGILATRISYLFNFRGPGMVIDTACSSGSAAIHQACQALKNKECDYALAGGVSIFSNPSIKSETRSMGMVESGDSIVKTFDKNANGTVWGEGIGVLMLKTLSKAIADKDNIYAVIKATALNNDGASNGITAPNAEAQEEVIVQAWKDAKINPEDISYIEAHGTGTVLGDPIEVKGLVNAFSQFTDKKQFCAIGSVKPSIGHLVGASGLAAIIKIALSLKKGKIPATVNFEEPNPYIDFCASPIYVNDHLRTWKRNDSPRIAALNSFGFSGTNCHIVLGEAPTAESEKNDAINEPQILTISARSENALVDYINRYSKFLSRDSIPELSDICYTANTGRGHFEYRIALILNSLEDLKTKISYIKENGLENLKSPGIFYGMYNLVPKNKKVRGEHDITEGQKGQISQEAVKLISDSISKVSLTDSEVVNKLCELYVSGAEFEWDRVYSAQVHKKVPVPVYPLERIRLWAETKKFKKQEYSIDINNSFKNAHPLFDDKGIAWVDRYFYRTTFNVNRHWVLKDHKVMGNFVVPGTTYLEMAREACRSYYKDKKIEFRDVIFLTPMVVSENGKKAQTIVKKVSDHLEFVVTSMNEDEYADDDISWETHVEGKIYPINDDVSDIYNIDELRNRCNISKMEYDVNAKRERDTTGGFELGDRWNNVSRVDIGKDEAVLTLQLPDKFCKDVDGFSIHPSLMDNAVNALSQSIGEGMYLPLSYKSMKVFGRMPSKFFSYVIIKNLNKDNLETFTFDVLLLNQDGSVFAEIKDYVIKKVHKAASKFDELSGKKASYYGIDWVESDPLKKVITNKTGSVLIFNDDKGLAGPLADKFISNGFKVLEVNIGEEYEKVNADKYIISNTEDDYRKLLSDIKEQSVSKIIHLMSITNSDQVKNYAELEQAKNRGLYSLFRLTRALVKEGYNNDIDIVLLANYTNPVLPDDHINPENAALFGLAKVVGQEYKNLSCKCIDTDEITGLDDIFTEILTANSGNEVALRKGKRYLPCFTKLNPNDYNTEEIKFKDDGVYIITGGTGGIGLAIANYIASNAKANIILANRSKMPDASKWEEILNEGTDKKLCKKISDIKEIEEKGANVVCSSIDVSNENSVQTFINELKDKYGKIDGIVHCAGVAGDGIILRKSEEVFNQVISPKINGTWLLNKATESENLDFFIMSSSMATLTGGTGQGDYTAANSYMDTFTVFRNAMGKKTLTINWPAWNETGMAVEYGVNDNNAIFKSISTAKGIDILNQLLNLSIKRAYVGELNLKAISAVKDNLPVMLSQNIKNALEKFTTGSTTKESDTKKESKSFESIAFKGIEEKDLNETELKLAYIWARVLETNEVDIYLSFSDMGGDSILATQLLKEIEKDYPDVINIADIFTYPSVVQMAEYIDNCMGKGKEDIKVSEESNDDEELSDQKLMDLLNGVESGDVSIETSLGILTGGKDE